MGENSFFFGGLGHNEESPTDWWSSKYAMVLLCPPFSSLLPLFFYGKFAGSKYSSVCALYAEKEQQCLAAGFACRYTTHIVVLFLIFETSLHNGGAQCTDNSSGGAHVDVFILWLWTFVDKTGGYAVFGAVHPPK